MYISNGIAYAGEQEPIIKVCGVRPLPGHRLWLRFTTGEAKVFDFTPLLKDAGLRRWPMNIPLRASILTTV